MGLTPFRILASEPAFENRWWRIVKETVELPDGTTDAYFINHALGGALIVPVTADGKVVVNRQYKHGAREVVQEFAIGRIDADDADPLAAAKRELLEETGYAGGDWEPLATFISNPTSSTSRVHVFLARGVRKEAAPTSNPREIVETEEIDPSELLARAADGRFATHASLAALLAAGRKLGWLTPRA